VVGGSSRTPPGPFAPLDPAEGQNFGHFFWAVFFDPLFLVPQDPSPERVPPTPLGWSWPAPPPRGLLTRSLIPNIPKGRARATPLPDHIAGLMRAIEEATAAGSRLRLNVCLSYGTQAGGFCSLPRCLCVFLSSCVASNLCEDPAPLGDC